MSSLPLAPAEIEPAQKERKTLVTATTRRTIVVGAAAAGVLAMSPALAQTPVASPVAGSFPRTVVDASGNEVTIPTRPERVYCVRNFVDMDTCLALGVIPAGWGTFPGRNLQPYQVAAGGKDNGIDVTDGINFEEMLSRDVDLVIGSKASLDILPEEVAAFAEINIPVVALPELDVLEQLRIAGEAFGREDEAARVSQEFSATVQAFTPGVMPTSLSILMGFDTTEFYLYTAASVASKSLEELGLPALSTPVLPAADAERQDYVTLSLERAADIDAEWVIGLIYDSTATDQISGIPVFESIPAVQAGRYRELVDEVAWAMSGPSVLALPITIAALQEAFSE
ncbi:MAG: ABC transporter substrate-binding protein [Thermomicrobiales bacterium]